MVTAYLDTHVVVWLAEGKLARISRDARDVIEDSLLLVSPFVLLELEYLHEIGRTRLAGRDVFLKIQHEIGIEVCDRPFLQVTEAAVHEIWTRDPFDRMIVAQAKVNGFASLISADEKVMANYPRTVW